MANKIRSDQIENIYTKTETNTEIKNSIDAVEIGGKNLLSVKNSKNRVFLTAGGQESSNSAWSISDYIKASPDTIYITDNYLNLGVGPSTCFYDADKVFISGIANGNTNSGINNTKDKDKRRLVITPTNASYVRVSYETADSDSITFQKGNKSTTHSLAPEDQISDWNQSDETAFDFIKNKPTADIAKGVQAFNWGNHATQGYLKSADLNGQATQSWVTSNFIPTSHPVNAVTGQNITNWNTAFTNNHTHANKTVLDGIAAANVTNWNNAHSYSQVGHIPLAQKGAVNGIASLDSNGQVPSGQLPSYVDDVIEAANLAALNNLPLIQKMTGKIYVTLDTNRTYRWSGTQFVMITTGEVDSVNGKKGIVTLTTTDISEGTNQYFTTARARTSVSGSTGITYSSSTGAISVKYGTTAGTAAQGNDSRINNGQTAYEWGNHRYAGYASGSWVESQLNNKVENGGGVKGFEISTDDRVMRGYILNYYGSDNTPIPVLTVSQGDDRYLSVTHPASDITAIQIFKWASAYEWGNHASAGYATQTWSNSNFIPKTHPVFNVTQAQINNWAIKDGSNASGIWKHAAYGLDLNPDIDGGTLSSRGSTTSLRNAFYGNVGGIVQDPSDSPIANQWTNRIKILHSNSQGYFTELAHSFTGEEGLWHRRLTAGVLTPYVKLLDTNNGVTLDTPQDITGRKIFNTTSNPTTTNLRLRGDSSVNPTLAFLAEGRDWGGLQFNGSFFSFTNVDGTGFKSVKATQFIRNGGTSTQVMMADGSVKELSAIGGGASYTQGTNITIIGTTISVADSPTFAGNVTAPGFFMSSSRKLKKNIKPFENPALDLIDELKIVSFDYKKGPKNKVGIIAEDSPEIFLSEEKDSVDLYNTVYIQAKAIQELNKEIEELKKLMNHV